MRFDAPLSLRVLMAAVSLPAAGLVAGCAMCDAFHARYREPRYVITDSLYMEAPHRIAVLPFAGPTDNKRDLEKGAICRKIFYQHLSVTPFEDIGLYKTDNYVLNSAPEAPENVFKRLFEHVRQIDVFGVTSVMSLPPLLDQDKFNYHAYTNLVGLTRAKLGAEACVVGYTRSYGRFYAVVFSSLGLSTVLELRSTRTGDLLWRGEARERNYEVPLTLNLLDLPSEIVSIWKSSRGLAMDMLAYGVYRDLAETIPYVGEPRKVFVRATKARTPYFHKPTVWMMGREGVVLRGETLPFLIEQNGWYKCVAENGNPVWVFRRHARLVDDAGFEVTRYDEPQIAP